MSAKQFREEILINAIAEELSKLQSDNQQLLVWQQKEGKRLIKKALIEDISFEQKCIFLLFTEESLEKFNSDLPIFITNNINTIAFDSNILMEDNKQLISKYPKKLLIPEHRNAIRHEFNKDSDSKVYLSYGTSSERRDGEYQVKDISIKGVCLFVPKKLTRYVYKGESLKIRWKHENQIITIPSLAIHISNQYDSFHLGVSFLDRVSQEQVNSLIQ